MVQSTRFPHGVLWSELDQDTCDVRTHVGFPMNQFAELYAPRRQLIALTEATQRVKL